MEIIDSNYIGIINIGTDKKSIFEYAIRRNIVNKTSIDEELDFSLNTDLYKNMTKYQHYNICPVSNSDKKIKYFDLGDMPIVNNLTNTFEESINARKFPLSVSVFEESNLSVLDIVVDPDEMFSNYTFRSATNKPYYDHCKEMYRYILGYVNIRKDDICVDIGGNDGTLLLAFNETSEELGLPTCEKLNIDPSKNVSSISSNRGINTIVEYFGENTYKIISKKVKIIVSTNVFQHLYDIKSFVRGINNLLEDDGIWCLEFPYWGNSMETNQFDQVYHEHIYYYLVTPLNKFFENNNLKIVNITEHFIHGGSLRLIITKKNSKILPDNTKQYYFFKEKKFDKSYYLKWSKNIEDHLIKCKNVINSLDGNIVGFGAAAKGCIFLNKLKIDYKVIKYVIDDTESKQNKYIPGTGIKIIDRKIINEEKIDYILIMAHNFSDYIIRSLNEYGYKGKFVIFLPEIKIIDN